MSKRDVFGNKWGRVGNHVFAGVALVVIASCGKDRALCTESSACLKEGVCSSDKNGNCVANSEAACRASEGCKDHGNCVLSEGRCVPGSDADCSKSKACVDKKAGCFFVNPKGGFVKGESQTPTAAMTIQTSKAGFDELGLDVIHRARSADEIDPCRAGRGRRRFQWHFSAYRIQVSKKRQPFSRGSGARAPVSGG